MSECDRPCLEDLRHHVLRSDPDEPASKYGCLERRPDVEKRRLTVWCRGHRAGVAVAAESVEGAAVCAKSRRSEFDVVRIGEPTSGTS